MITICLSIHVCHRIIGFTECHVRLNSRSLNMDAWSVTPNLWISIYGSWYRLLFYDSGSISLDLWFSIFDSRIMTPEVWLRLLVDITIVCSCILTICFTVHTELGHHRIKISFKFLYWLYFVMNKKLNCTTKYCMTEMHHSNRTWVLWRGG